MAAVAGSASASTTGADAARPHAHLQPDGRAALTAARGPASRRMLQATLLGGTAPMCAQLHTCAVRICARARDSALTASCVFSRLVRCCLRVRVCVRVFACVRACVQLRACVQVCVRVGVCWPSRGTAGTSRSYRSARRWPRLRFAYESSVGPQVRRGRAVRWPRRGLTDMGTRP